MKPVAVVVGIMVAIVVGFGTFSAVTSPPGSQAAPSSAPPGSAQKVPGTSLLAVPAARVLSPIEQPGVPPANILDSLWVPQGARDVSNSGHGPSTNLYDEHMTFQVSGTEGAVYTFYRTELARDGWKLAAAGTGQGAPGTLEVLAQKAGTDGWFWEAGVVIAPTTFGAGAGGASGAGEASGSNGAGGAGTTSFTMTLFQTSAGS